jgi:hypothetical protein
MDRKARREERELERLLRSLRAEARPELVESLTTEVLAASRRLRSPWRRLGVAVALTGLMIVAVASFGGVSYGSSAAREAVDQVLRVKPKHPTPGRTLASRSAADAQYGHFTPPTTPQTPSGGGGGGGGGSTQPPAAPPAKGNAGGSTGGTTGSGGTTGGGQAGGGIAGSSSGGEAPTSSSLPFTGLSLWIPLAGGLLLIGLGLALRIHARRLAPRA